jgi:hypothetical protein
MTAKKIVLATFGTLGDLHPFIAVALQLRKRGHRPVIASWPDYREKVEAEGIEFLCPLAKLEMRAGIGRGAREGAGSSCTGDLAKNFCGDGAR